MSCKEHARFALPAFGLVLAALLAHPGFVSAQAQLGQPVEKIDRSPKKVDTPPPPVAVPVVQPAPVASQWEVNPPYRLIPKLGMLPVLPTGPGYYSMRDWLEGNYREAPPKIPLPRHGAMPFGSFDLNYNYLDSPKNTEYDWSDCFHRIHLGDNWLISSGGELRYLHQTYNSFNLTGRDDAKNLLRTRVYGDLWYRDTFRVFVEFQDAQFYGTPIARQATDADHSDLLNAFIDVKLAEIDGKNAYLRAGRQQVYLGSQRLIGQLDWTNTNRTFQGFRAFRQGDKFDVDAFFLQPVVPNVNQFDWVDTHYTLAGLWTTYRPQKGHFIDVYDMVSSNRNRLTKSGIDTGPFDINTFGVRYLGNKDERFLWDFEGMMQVGQQGSARNIFAQAATAGLGYHWKEACLNPTVWGFFDYASGDSNPNNGHSTTFNQLFPFGHYYLGWADLVGRQNIMDANFHLYLYPNNWTTVWFQYHHFMLASATDALYNAAGNPILRDKTGAAGRNVGDEFDFVVNFCLSKHTNLLVSYNILDPGRFVNTLSKGPDNSAFYLMVDFRW